MTCSVQARFVHEYGFCRQCEPEEAQSSSAGGCHSTREIFGRQRLAAESGRANGAGVPTADSVRRDIFIESWDTGAALNNIGLGVWAQLTSMNRNLEPHVENKITKARHRHRLLALRQFVSARQSPSQVTNP